MRTANFIYILLALLFFGNEMKAQQLNLLVGTYTKSGKSEGIYVYNFEPQTGKAIFKNKISLTNPSYMAISKNEELVYTVSEAGTGKGALSALQFDKQTGALKLLNQQSSNGDGPCHVSVDRKNRHVFVSNYAGGSFSVLPVLSDGSLGAGVQSIAFKSNGVGKGQQEKPHAHSAVLSPDEKYLFVCDLGNDEIISYRYEAKSNTPLSIKQTARLVAGSGPRHFVFHPNKKFAYSIHEIAGRVEAFRYRDGMIESIQRISTVPENPTGAIGSGDIHISPDGKFLYASNRAKLNDIAIFSIQSDGTLKFAGRQSTLGETPRNFIIDPTGNYLLAANQNSDNIIVFKRDQATGLLTDTGEKIAVGAPVCLKFGKAD